MSTTGTVKWFNVDKGYGFIAPDDGTGDLFAHHSAVLDRDRGITEGQRVTFDVTQGPKGRQAEHITAG